MQQSAYSAKTKIAVTYVYTYSEEARCTGIKERILFSFYIHVSGLLRGLSKLRCPGTLEESEAADTVLMQEAKRLN